MPRPLLFTFALLVALVAGCGPSAPAPQSPVDVPEDTAPEATDGWRVWAAVDQAPGNITVLADGRVIVSLHQHFGPETRVAVVGEEGSLTPFPNARLANGPNDDLASLDSVLGIQSLGDVVWMLDNGMRSNAPRKLLGWNTATDAQEALIDLDGVSPDNAFLNDFAITQDGSTIVIADPAGGDNAALIVVNVNSGEARRVLEGHTSVVPNPELDLVMEDIPVEIARPDGTTFRPKVGVNPIALTADDQWVVFGPMHGQGMFRVPLALIADPTATDEAIAAGVERFAEKPICDGISIDVAGNVYLGDLANDTIGVLSPAGGYEPLISDPRLQWVDAFAFGPDGVLYAVVNQLHRGPVLNAGTDRSSAPYHVIAIEPKARGLVGR